MNYTLIPAAENDLEGIFALYAQRVKWMDKKGIHQWNETDYLGVYPMEYYRDHMINGRLYAFKNEDGALLGAAALLTYDGRWDDAAALPAYYLHHLVTDLNAPRGIGAELLAQCEDIAKEHGKGHMRLDCAVDNDFLKQYYGKKGYAPAGICIDGAYTGLRLEKKLS